MVSTRSTSRSTTAVLTSNGTTDSTPVAQASLPSPAPTPRKRKLETPSTPTPAKRKRGVAPPTPITPAPVPAAVIPVQEEEDILPPTLCFDLAAAKKHLVAADPRFGDVFAVLPCKPFEVLDVVHPFRTLVTSILGQQISWMAARSITAKFLHLFDPSLPMKHDGEPPMPLRPFPEPARLAAADVAMLRTAGLSGRKAEYVLDLASRFADGRLSARKLAEADDEEMARLLIEVRGIGRWTVDMFAMFSARRPDIMPYGDLGVQRGLLRWVLASHEPALRLSVIPSKLPQPVVEASPTAAEAIEPAPEEGDASALPPIPAVPAAPPSTPKRKGKKEAASLPTPKTPSNANANGTDAATPGLSIPGSHTPVALPEGLTVAALRSRLAGKKIKKGLYLSPEEMDALTEGWKPYRSIGVWYMWALAEETP